MITIRSKTSAFSVANLFLHPSFTVVQSDRWARHTRLHAEFTQPRMVRVVSLPANFLTYSSNVSPRSMPALVRSKPAKAPQKMPLLLSTVTSKLTCWTSAFWKAKVLSWSKVLSRRGHIKFSAQAHGVPVLPSKGSKVLPNDPGRGGAWSRVTSSAVAWTSKFCAASPAGFPWRILFSSMLRLTETAHVAHRG